MSEILIIEDEAALASALAAVCKRIGFATRVCANAAAGISLMSNGEFRLLILDIGLPDMSGLEVLKHARAKHAAMPVVIITAHGNLDNAVAARQLGAAAYLVKPLDLRDVEQTIGQVLATGTPASAGTAKGAPQRARLLGSSPAMQGVFLEIAHATTTDAAVLLSGPTGVGKTLAA